MDPEKIKEMGIQICIPGMRLCAANANYASGPGTYLMKEYIYATLAGVVKMVEDEENKVTLVTVESPRNPTLVPRAGDVVTAKITVVNPRQVNCAIICVGPTVLSRTYRGLLKKEYMKATDKDKIDPYKCFRPGDVILARVLPMTEIHCYQLSTSENELGVVIATAEGSPQGVVMIPTSWSEMQCPQTMIKEPRKVARVIPDVLFTKPKKNKSSNKEINVKEEVADEENN